MQVLMFIIQIQHCHYQMVVNNSIANYGIRIMNNNKIDFVIREGQKNMTLKITFLLVDDMF